MIMAVVVSHVGVMIRKDRAKVRDKARVKDKVAMVMDKVAAMSAEVPAVWTSSDLVAL